MKLSMAEFLSVVADHGIDTPEELARRGFHPKVVYAKAEKAADKNYTEYGVVADRPWLTEKGRAFLAGQTPGEG